MSLNASTSCEFQTSLSLLKFELELTTLSRNLFRRYSAIFGTIRVSPTIIGFGFNLLLPISFGAIIVGIDARVSLFRIDSDGFVNLFRDNRFIDPICARYVLKISYLNKSVIF